MARVRQICKHDSGTFRKSACPISGKTTIWISGHPRTGPGKSCGDRKMHERKKYFLSGKILSNASEKACFPATSCYFTVSESLKTAGNGFPVMCSRKHRRDGGNAENVSPAPGMRGRTFQMPADRNSGRSHTGGRRKQLARSDIRI